MLTVRVGFLYGSDVELRLEDGATVADLKWALFHSGRMPVHWEAGDQLIILRGDLACLDSDTVGDGWPYHAMLERAGRAHRDEWPEDWHDVETHAATIEVHVGFAHHQTFLRYIFPNGATREDLAERIATDSDSPLFGHDQGTLRIAPQHHAELHHGAVLADAETYHVDVEWPEGRSW